MKRGFTLIEIIAIIALLGIIAIAVFPMIGDSISSRKETQYNNLVSTIKSAAKVYYADNSSTTKVFLSTLVDEDYLSSGLTDPRSGEILDGCVYIFLDGDGYNNYVYMDDLSNCNASQLYYSLVVKPMGGTYNSTTDNTSYVLEEDETVEVLNPVRDGYEFTGWNYSCSECTIASNIFTMGNSNVVLTATWTLQSYSLTTDLDGGTISTAPPTSVLNTQTVELATPTKSGTTFVEWSIISGAGSSIDGNTLTIGANDTAIKAIYEDNVYTMTTHTCDRSTASYTKSTKTCSRSVSSYTQTKKSCTRSVSTYTVTRRQCLCNVYNVCSFATSTTTSSSCSVGSIFVCQAAMDGVYYTSACSVASYNYFFNTTYPTSDSCSVGTPFSCSSSTYGSSYIYACAVSSYNYFFNTTTSTASDCSTTSSFTCSSSTYNTSYVSACTIDSYDYLFTDSTQQINQCTPTSLFTCDESSYQQSYVTCEYTG